MASPDIYGMDHHKTRHKYPIDQRINATDPGDSQAFPASATITFAALTKVFHNLQEYLAQIFMSQCLYIGTVHATFYIFNEM